MQLLSEHALDIQLYRSKAILSVGKISAGAADLVRSPLRSRSATFHSTLRSTLFSETPSPLHPIFRPLRSLFRCAQTVTVRSRALVRVISSRTVKTPCLDYCGYRLKSKEKAHAETTGLFRGIDPLSRYDDCTTACKHLEIVVDC